MSAGKFQKRKRKAPIQCGACGDAALYTWQRLNRGICRSCGQDLNGPNYEKAKAELWERKILLALDGKR